MLLLFMYHYSLAQQKKIIRSHSISLNSLEQPTVPDTLTIIAVRVAFKKDNNRFTTGNGTFDPDNLSYLDNPGIRIDPLPHNKAYFEAHLKFAKNYFETVSGGKTHIKYRVLPKIYSLPNKIQAYSPTGKTFTNEKVARLARDTWQTVKQEGGFSTVGLNPQKTTFVIFHAGVGRDIELTGTTLDKTPQDIPSLYLGKKTLADLLNETQFDGFSVNNTPFKVTNSLILPQTLSRPGDDISGKQFVLQLSINGLLCASIGSYLGLPDLFNTNTGSSGIGRFGLMDGESFFSYQGLFPPEPSAWEKKYLGWQTPFKITASTKGPVSLPAASFHQPSSIAQYNLSTDEYFLVENRYRSPNNDGLTLKIQQKDGSTATQTFKNTNETFVNQSEGFTDLLKAGVVTDVSNFDWSLPGGLDKGDDRKAGTADDRILNGGILIWHIDEAVIRNELATQAVNANPGRRGVDLEEADGAQDIGRATNSTLTSVGRGSPYDFWWSGNDASVITLNDTLRFYNNTFGANTHPSNDSNSGAPSYFKLYNFSKNLPVASFKIRPQPGNLIKPISLPADSIPDRKAYTTNDADYYSSYPLSLSFYKTPSDSFLIIPTQQSVYALDLSDSSASLFDFRLNLPQQPYLGSSVILGEAPSSSQIAIYSWKRNGSTWDKNWNIQATANNAFLSSVNDKVLLPDFTNKRIKITSGALLNAAPKAAQRSISVGGMFSQLTDNEFRLTPGNKTYPLPTASKRIYTGALKISKNKSAFYLLTDKKLLVFDPFNFSRPKIIVKNTPLGWPAFADINGDGRIDFIYVDKKNGTLKARNLNGAMLSYFPIRPPKGAIFTGTPLIAHSSQNEHSMLYITTQDSLSMNIMGYTAKGNAIKGFPLFVGSVSDQKNQPVHPVLSHQSLYAVSHQGQLKAWKLKDVDEVLWGSRYGNGPYNKVSGKAGTTSGQPNPEISGVLNKKETYNWPNPAFNYTHLRFQTKGKGKVNLKVITPGGSVVFEKQFAAKGGSPEEHKISTQNWSSGLYLAMVTAVVEGEKSRKMLKIVVVH